MRAGDVVLAVFLRKRLGISLQQGFTVIMVDWFCDFVCVVAAFVGALALAPAIAAWTGHAVTIIVSVLVVAIAGLWVMVRYRPVVVSLVDRILAKVLPVQRERLMRVVEEILSGLSLVCTWRIATPLVLISGADLGAVGDVVLVRPACRVHLGADRRRRRPSAAAIALSFVVPLGPAGLGAFEVASVLSARGVRRSRLSQRIAFAVISHVFQLAMVLSLALLAASTQRLDYSSLKAAAEKR